MIASFIFHPFKHGWYSMKSARLSPGGVRQSEEPKENNCEPAKILTIPLIPYLSINNRLGSSRSLSSSHCKPVAFHISAIRGVPEANSTRVPCRKAIRT